MKNNPSFEEAINRLEEIVSVLEEGNLPLEDSLSLFEEGTKLAKICSTTLEKAEQKIITLTNIENIDTSPIEQNTHEGKQNE